IPATADTPELPTYAFDRHRYWLERTTHTPADPMQDRFWEAVDREDVSELAELVGIEAPEARSSLGSVLPAIAGWRQQWQGAGEFEPWRYRVEWDELKVSAEQPDLSGKWLVIAPASHTDHEH
ncbi:hypothetical protein, partial [Streptomyces sp. P17]|uniref:hypothetical protein n=1 Tax=Streptomyces sp. P17 TaxID=3074716 RepID=UPI0028F41C16